MKTIRKQIPSDLSDNQEAFLVDVTLTIQNLFPKTSDMKHFGDLETSNFGCNRHIVATGQSFVIANDDFTLWFAPYGKKSIELYKIEVYNQKKGLGSRLMQIITEKSLETRTTIFLRPVKYQNTPIEVLRKFYHSFGFRRCCKNVYWSNISLFNN